MNGSLRNFRIVSVGPLTASGGMIAFTRRAVGQARVDHRRGLVDAAADCDDDLVDDAHQVRVVDEPGVRHRRACRCARCRSCRAVDHHLGHGVVAQERLDRPVAEDVVGDLADDLRPLLARERRLVDGQLLGDRSPTRSASSRSSPAGVRNSRGPRCVMTSWWTRDFSSANGSMIRSGDCSTRVSDIDDGCCCSSPRPRLDAVCRDTSGRLAQLHAGPAHRRRAIATLPAGRRGHGARACPRRTSRPSPSSPSRHRSAAPTSAPARRG